MWAQGEGEDGGQSATFLLRSLSTAGGSWAGIFSASPASGWGLGADWESIWGKVPEFHSVPCSVAVTGCSVSDNIGG